MKNSFKQIVQNEKLSKEIDKQIENSIREKILIPGQELPAESELCKIFGVSRTVIREAIHMLGTRGLVTIKRGKKTVINEYHEALNLSPIQFYLECNLNDRLIRDWITIRSIMEPPLTRLAAINRKEKDLIILEDVVKKLGDKSNSNKKRAQLDQIFHSTIADATQNQIITLIMKPIYEMMPKIKSIVIKKSKLSKKFTNDEHQKIFDCIINKDSDGAFLSMVEHMESAKKSVYDTHI